jgi:hypothetical protein
MSKEDNRGMIDAYQKMLNDGTAFKEVDTAMLTEPSITEAGGTRGEEDTPEQPLGEKVETPEHEYHSDYTNHDSIMEQRINSLRQKASSGGSGGGGGELVKKGKSRLVLLEKKVEQLETAMILIMETHEQLLE